MFLHYMTFLEAFNLLELVLEKAARGEHILFILRSERSSVVERHLAKVRVEGSNPFARSSLRSEHSENGDGHSAVTGAT